MRRNALSMFSLLMVGCATMAHGPEQGVWIKSEPPGARVRVIPTGFEGITPVWIMLPRSTSHQAVLSLVCHEERRVQVDRRLSIMVLGNVFTGGLGLLIDFVTGGAWNLKPDEFRADMGPRTPGCIPRDT
jgi:hypothetical protein